MRYFLYYIHFEKKKKKKKKKKKINKNIIDNKNFTIIVYIN